MASKIWIKIESENLDSIKEVETQIKQLTQMYNLELNGPIPLPIKELKVTVRRTPCGDGSDTYETWRKRIYKRIIIVKGEDKDIRNVLKMKVPTDISIKVKLLPVSS
ncbi:MAG: 30S ribosomal protein S10 [Candidatus Anstonellales archaeon]